MNQNGTDTPEQVLKFAPKEKQRSDDSPLDEAGQAIVAKIQKAADLSNENCDRAMTLAHKLSMELRAAEDRIKSSALQLTRSARVAFSKGFPVKTRICSYTGGSMTGTFA
jgi:hypothetical protein